MISQNPFRAICTRLKSNAWELLPLEADELNRMSEQDYAEFFSRLTQNEQQLLELYTQSADASSKEFVEIKERGAPTQEPKCVQAHAQKIACVKELALKNLAAIRQMKQLYNLFNGLEGNGDPAYLRKSVCDKIPEADRADVLAKALTVADELPCPFRRMHLLQTLALLLPSQRANALPHIISILKRCTTPQTRNILLSFVAQVPRERLDGYLLHLHTLLAYIPVDEWPSIHETLRESQRKADIVFFATCILPPAIRYDEMRHEASTTQEVLQAIMEVHAMENILMQISSLTRLCHNGAHIHDIIRDVAQLPDAERGDVVQRVLTLVNGATHGCVVYDTLGVIATVRPHRRIRVYDLLTQAYGTIPRTDQPRILHRLAEVLPAISAINTDTGDFRGIFLHVVRVNPVQEELYHLEVERKKFKSSPFQVLHTLTELFKKSVKTVLQIWFTKEPAIGHGPSKELVSELFRAVCEKLAMPLCRVNGLYRPKSLKLSIEEREVFNNLGQLFMFCLTASEEYLLGVELDLSVFQALTLLQEKHIRVPFEKLVGNEEGFNEMFAIFEKMNSEHEEDRLSISHMKAAGRCEAVLDAMQEALVPCIAIKQGMMDSFFPKDILAGMNAEQLELRLQGLLQPDVVVSKLRFDDSVPEKKKQWVINWVRSLNSAKMKDFLSSATSARSIGNKVIHIKASPDKVSRFHTCDNQVELALSEVDSEKLMFKLLNKCIGDNSFSMI